MREICGSSLSTVNSETRPKPGMMSFGAISMSGNNTKFRSAMPGCGNVIPFWSISWSPNTSKSRSRVLGPQRTPRLRPLERSMWCSSFNNVIGASVERRLATALMKSGCATDPNGAERYNDERAIRSVLSMLSNSSKARLICRSGSSRLLPRPR